MTKSKVAHAKKSTKAHESGTHRVATNWHANGATALTPQQIAHAAEILGVRYMELKVLVARREELLRVAALHTVGEPQAYPDDPRRLHPWSDFQTFVGELEMRVPMLRKAIMGVIAAEGGSDEWRVHFDDLDHAIAVIEDKAGDLAVMVGDHVAFQTAHPQLFPTLEVPKAVAS